MHFLGNNLRYLRKKSGKNQGQIAEMVGKGQTTVGNWEGGVSEPSLKDLLILSNYFGIKIDDLLRIDLARAEKEYGQEPVKVGGRVAEDYRHEQAESSQTMAMERAEDMQNPILKMLESMQKEINEMKTRFGEP